MAQLRFALVVGLPVAVGPVRSHPGVDLVISHNSRLKMESRRTFVTEVSQKKNMWKNALTIEPLPRDARKINCDIQVARKNLDMFGLLQIIR